MTDFTEIDPKLTDLLEKLQRKYDRMGQDMSSYLEGLLHANFLTYWDYIHLDTLLTLQNPKTDFPDETIFIAYHQVTELYFKLILHEMDQISEEAETIDAETFTRRVERCNDYFALVSESFRVMYKTLDQEEFRQFRMSLLPSSGFQSVQYRLIALHATDLFNLVTPEVRDREGLDAGDSLESLYMHVFWMAGATELATGKETLTLKMFERKYAAKLIRTAQRMERGNLRSVFLSRFSKEGQPNLVEALRKLDAAVNVNWALAHLKVAGRHLQAKKEAIEATGGTNWQEYLPPRRRMVQFYPELWNEQEQAEWGRKEYV